MPAYKSTTLSALGTVQVNPGANPNNIDNVAVFQLTGGTATITGTFQASVDGTNFINIPTFRMDTGALETATSPNLPSGTTVRSWKADITGMNYVQFNATVLSAGTMGVIVQTQFLPNGVNIAAVANLAGNQAISGTMTVTSTGALALAVGAGGATNPALTVDDSTSSQADGLTIIGLASGSGVSLKTITPGTNSPLNISGAGSGNVVMNQSGTGLTVFTTGMSITDAKNVALATTTGTIIGTTTLQKLGFFGATPVVQPVASSASSATGAAGTSTGVSLDTKFTGGGTAQYTIGGVITQLKALGLLAA